MISGFVFSFLIFLASLSFGQSVNKLPSLNIDPSSVTVSGVSAGGFMAVQLQVALSSVFRGAASASGGIYWCSEGNPLTAQSKCMKKPEGILVSEYIARAKAEEQFGQIEKLSNLKNAKLFIFASPADAVIKYQSSDKLYEFYSKFMPKQNIAYQNQIASAHGWVTKNYGNSCQAQGTPWLNNCNYDLAGDILKHMYGPLLDNRSFRNNTSNQLFTYDQSEFKSGNSALFDYGYVYVPKSCQSRGRSACRLHVALHGCQMNSDYVQDQWATHSGFNGWAEANGIVVLYPQVSKVSGINPYACWDWFGYTGRNFANRSGSQIISIQKMVYRLLGKF